jgi:hypothetical protein
MHRTRPVTLYQQAASASKLTYLTTDHLGTPTVAIACRARWPSFELAWALVRRWWGNGYATEGARAALTYAFTALQKDRVISLIHPENRASIRVALRIGESLEGHTDHLGRKMLCYGVARKNDARPAPA